MLLSLYATQKYSFPPSSNIHFQKIKKKRQKDTEIIFGLLKKSRIVYAVSKNLLDSTSLEKVKSLQNALRYMQKSFLLRCFKELNLF